MDRLITYAVGNLTRDPEKTERADGKGDTVVVTIGRDTSYKDKETGDKVEQSKFHRFFVPAKLQENVLEYMAKGKRVGIVFEIDNYSAKIKDEDGQIINKKDGEPLTREEPVFTMLSYDFH